MLRTFSFRLLANATQKLMLDRILDECHDTYNAALQERREAWELQRKAVSRYMQHAELTELRKDAEFSWIACDIQRDPLRRLERAFEAFFRRVKAGEKPGFPRFRSRDRYDSFSFSSPKCRNSRLRIPKVGTIRIRGGRCIRGQVKTATIKKDDKRWNVRIVCEVGPGPTRHPISSVIGIDVGINTLVTLSDGQQVENQRWIGKHEGRIAAANKRLARKQRRSQNRLRAKEALRRAYQRAANARSNYLHHVSKWLVEHYDLIAHEELIVQNMVRSHFSKSIMDAAWTMLIGQIAYKAEEAGKWVVPVKPHGTSQRCSGCGHSVPKELSCRVHSCPHCGLRLGRDHNAACNILALGMSAARSDPPERIARTVYEFQCSSSRTKEKSLNIFL